MMSSHHICQSYQHNSFQAFKGKLLTVYADFGAFFFLNSDECDHAQYVVFISIHCVQLCVCMHDMPITQCVLVVLAYKFSVCSMHNLIRPLAMNQGMALMQKICPVRLLNLCPLMWDCPCLTRNGSNKSNSVPTVSMGMLRPQVQSSFLLICVLEISLKVL